MENGGRERGGGEKVVKHRLSKNSVFFKIEAKKPEMSLLWNKKKLILLILVEFSKLSKFKKSFKKQQKFRCLREGRGASKLWHCRNLAFFKVSSHTSEVIQSNLRKNKIIFVIFELEKWLKIEKIYRQGGGEVLKYKLFRNLISLCEFLKIGKHSNAENISYKKKIEVWIRKLY